MEDILALVNRAKEDTESLLKGGSRGPRTNFWKPENGDNKIRIMPAYKEGTAQFWRKVGQHWDVSPNYKGPVFCPQETEDMEGACPICDLVSELRKDKSNLEAQQMVKDLRVSRSYFMNVVVSKDPVYTASDVAEFKQENPGQDVPFEVGHPKVRCYAANISVFDDILALIQSSQSNITDFDTGREVIIKKIPNKDYRLTRYQVLPDFNAKPFEHKETVQLPNLDEVGRRMEFEEIKKLLLEGQADNIGAMSAPALSEPTPTESSDLEAQMRAALGQ